MENEEYPAALVSMVSLVLAAEMALGLAFNISVLVVSRGRLVTGAEHGNTFLASLTVVDILACLTALPLTLASARMSRYHDNLIFCLFSEGAVALSTTGSSLTLLCITLERYQAVTRPAYRGLLSSRPFVFLLPICALSAFTFCAPFFLHRRDALVTKEVCRALLSSEVNVTNTTTFSEANSTNIHVSGASSNWREVAASNQTSISCFCTLVEVADTDSVDKACLVSCSLAVNASGYLRAYELLYVISFSVTVFAMGLFYAAILKVVRRRLAAKEAATSRKTTLTARQTERSKRDLLDAERSNNGGSESTDTGNRQLPVLPATLCRVAVVRSDSEQSSVGNQGFPSQEEDVGKMSYLDVKNRNAQERSLGSLRASQSYSGRIIVFPQRADDKKTSVVIGLNQPSEACQRSSLESVQLSSQQSSRQATREQVTADLGPERRIMWVSLGIVCVFVLCWGPHVVLTVVEMVVDDSMEMEASHLLTLSLAYLTVVVHPLIYAFSRKKFRESLMRLWRRFRDKRQHRVRVGPGPVFQRATNRS